LPPFPPASPPTRDVTANPGGSVDYPDYPPYVPSPQFDTTQGWPRSILDGIHGTSGDEPRHWAPNYPGELPPFWTKDYVQLPHDPTMWVPATGPAPAGQTAPASHQPDGALDHPGSSGDGGKLDVTPADLHRAADDYADLQARAAAVGPQAVEEVNRIIATHGAMGYPVAVGVVAGLARRAAAVSAAAARFGQYGERFTGHATTYLSTDHDGAGRYSGDVPSVSA